MIDYTFLLLRSIQLEKEKRAVSLEKGDASSDSEMNHPEPPGEKRPR